MPESQPPFELLVPEPAPRPVPPPPPPALPAGPASGVWPGAVPGRAFAERALADHLSGTPSLVATHAEATRAVAGGLAPLERGALRDEIDDPEAARALRRAAAVRWRLAVALRTRPPPGAPVDSPALDALMTEVDQALLGLGALAEQAGPPEVEEAVGAVRAALAEQAQRFIRDVHRPVEGPAPARPRTPTPGRATRPTPDAPRPARRWLVGSGALLACALLLAPERKAAPLLRPFPGAPAGLLGMENPETGVILLQTQDHLPPSAEFEAFAARMRREGWSVEERYPKGQGAYLLTRRPPP